MRSRLVAIAMGFAAHAAGAQDVRVTGASWLQSIDLRPLRRDSVLAGTIQTHGGVTRGPDGQLVNCTEGSGYCTFLTSGPRETTSPFLQDLSVAGWGFGQGISFHAHARFREALGSSSASWPRIDDRFDLLDAYVELDRPRLRARVGRQWSLGGLGAYNYDGGSLTLRRGWWDGDAFGGRALVQGLFEPYTSEEIGAVDDLPPENSAWLVGARLRARPGRSAAITAMYLRLLQDDRSGVYAERASLDLSVRAFGLGLSANTQLDVASNTLNEARLRVSRPLVRRLDAAVDVRRHRPFFELWTIWGAFAPVGFDEGRATLSWASPDGTLMVSGGGAYRVYEDAGTGLEFTPLRNDGWRVNVDGAWSPGERFTVTGGYGRDIGFGSAQDDGTFGVSWRPVERLEVGAAASALQTIYEFRVGTGRVLGGSANGTLRLTSDVRLRVDAGVYKHRLTNDAHGQDWSQRRASARLEWAVGADPGAAR